MHDKNAEAPEPTALRVALWRALHLEVDAAPPLLDDAVGLRLAAPDANWRQRPDMDVQGTRGFRASIVGRARFVEELAIDQARRGVTQYIILGAGLDTFAQRHPELAGRLRVFEVDQPAPQAWKRRRLEEEGYGVPDGLRLVPVDFESGQSWWGQLMAHGFRADRPAVAVSTGVSMYLTREANLDTLRRLGALAPGSTLALSFLLPPEWVDEADRPQYRMVRERAAAAGTPFLSLFSPEQMLALAAEAGFVEARHVSRADLVARYFAGRADGLVPSSGEEFLVATTR